MKRVKNRWLFFIPVVCGIGLLLFLKSGRKDPVRLDIGEQSRTVRVIRASEMAIVPKVVGYGYVQPVETWQAIPEVSGRVVEVHPELKRGTFVSKGDLLLRIDPESYDLAESRGQATVKSVEAQLLELEQEKSNAERLLEIEKKALSLAQNEVTRLRSLYKKGVISPSDLEQEEKILLSQETKVNNLINSLNLIPSRRNALLARKDSDISSLSELQLDIEKTVIRAPFDCRLAEVNIEKNQFATMGTSLLKAISIAAVEIPVQLSPRDFVNLLPSSVDSGRIMQQDFTMDILRDMIGLKAQVRLPLFSDEATWPAEFRRTSDSIDVQTGAMTVFVAVQRPYEKVVPGRRPPLVPNMYCEVELLGTPRAGRYVIPAHALHEGYIYLVDGQNRLERKKVDIEMIIDDMAILRGGLSGPATVIVTDLVPAIDGQLLESVVDGELESRIVSMDAQKSENR